MKNENIKNLKIRSKALTMAGVILMTMVFGGCTKSENTQSQTPVEVVNTTTPTIEPTVAPTATSVPTIEPTVAPTATSVPTTKPTIEPTATPEPTPELTADEINEIAASIMDMCPNFFAADLNEYFRPENGKQIRQMTVEYVADCIAILNGKQPLYEPYDSSAVFDLISLNAVYCYYVENASMESDIKFKYAFLPGTYEYEFFERTDDSFMYIMDGNATQEEMSQIFGEWLKILVDEPVNGQIASKVLNAPCYFLAVSAISHRILCINRKLGIRIDEMVMSLGDIYSKLKDTPDGGKIISFAMMADQWAEYYGLDLSSFPKGYEPLLNIINTGYDDSLLKLENYVPTDNVGLLSSRAYGYDDTSVFNICCNDNDDIQIINTDKSRNRVFYPKSKTIC